MTHIDRRRVLTSLAAGTAIAGGTTVIPKAALAAPEADTFPEPTEHREGWLLAQQRRDSAEPASVDFWSMPWDEIRYDNYLPPQIRRGLVSYEEFPRPAETHNAIGAFQDSDENRHGWFDLQKLERFIADPEGSQPLVPLLDSFLGADSAGGHTCLMALDSTSMSCGSPWEHVLPAFRRHYRSTVGIKHFSNRGFCQQRAYYQRNFRKSYFDHDFVQPASLCEATIVTSEGLIETDTGLCPRAETYDLAGELVRRLGHALLDPVIRKRIVGVRAPNSAPRLFALGSATVNAPSSFYDLQMILHRQSMFVSGSFAPLTVDALPLFIVTSSDEDTGFEPVMDTIAYAALTAGYSLNRGMFATARAPWMVHAPCYRPETRYSPGRLDLIALWPFTIGG